MIQRFDDRDSVTVLLKGFANLRQEKDCGFNARALRRQRRLRPLRTRLVGRFAAQLAKDFHTANDHVIQLGQFQQVFELRLAKVCAILRQRRLAVIRSMRIAALEEQAREQIEGFVRWKMLVRCTHKFGAFIELLLVLGLARR